MAVGPPMLYRGGMPPERRPGVADPQVGTGLLGRRPMAAISSITRRACPTTRAPTGVSATSRVLRCSTRAPSVRSSAATVRDTEACESSSRSAAAVNDPQSTTASRARSWRTSGSIRLAYRCLQYWHFPYDETVLIPDRVSGTSTRSSLRGVLTMLVSALGNQ